MIFITGDTHGDIDIQKLSSSQWKEGAGLTRNDYLIVLGDFGLPFLTSDATDEKLSNHLLAEARKNYRYWIDWLSQKPYTVLWIDGNHDNHPYWNKQDIVKWNGGKVNLHPLADNVIHLRRGEYYNIDGKTFWVMGGAKSHDRAMRVEGFTWWKEEIPSMKEMEHGLDTLQEHGNKVDYILSHTMPSEMVIPMLHFQFKDTDPTESYLNEIYKTVDFKYWFCGHFHTDVKSDIFKIQVLYDKIVNINEY